MSRLGRIAAAYASGQVFGHAVPVFPVGPDKRPLTVHGFLEAAADHEQLASWWRRWPGAGIGLPTGRWSGLVVLDLDGPQAASWYRGALVGAGQGQPLTPVARTPRGGWHVFYGRPSDGLVRCSAGRLGDGVDVRGEGGYVVLWPSRAQAGRWRWVRPPWRTPLAPCPRWLVEPEPSSRAARVPQVNGDARRGPSIGTPYALAALRQEGAAVAATPEGGRNARLNVAAFNLGQLIGAGLLDEGLAERALAAAGELAGLAAREVRATVRSGLQAGRRSPRTGGGA